METTEQTGVRFRRRDAISGIALGLIIGVLLPFILGRIGKTLPLQAYYPVLFPVLCAGGLYVAALLGKWLPVLFQIGKFGVVGVTNFVVDTAAFHFFILLSGAVVSRELFVLIALPITTWTFFKIFSFIAANAHSFFWNKFWTFEQKGTGEAKKEYAGFFIISVVGLLINSGSFSVVFALRPEGGSEAVWGTIGVAVGSFIGLFWNFVGYKFFVFKK